MGQYWLRETRDGQTQGPFGGKDVRKFAAEGSITRQWQISKDQKKWHPITAIPNLFPAGAASANQSEVVQEAAPGEQDVAPVQQEEMPAEQEPARMEQETAQMEQDAAALEQEAAPIDQPEASSLDQLAQAVQPIAGRQAPAKKSRLIGLAKASLAAPFATIAITSTTRTVQSRDDAIGLACANIACMLVGIGLAVYALSAQRREGAKGVKGWAISGLAFNGLLLLTYAVILADPRLFIHDIKKDLVGHWQYQPRTNAALTKADLTLKVDDTFDFNGTEQGVAASMSGHWFLNDNDVIGVKIEQVKVGNQSIVGQQMLLGKVKTINDQNMSLQTDHGDESYTRIN